MDKFRHGDREYDVRATRSAERVNEAGKRVDPLLRFQVLIDGQEYRFSLFVPWVDKLVEGKISEVFGVLLKDKPDWKESGRGLQQRRTESRSEGEAPHG